MNLAIEFKMKPEYLLVKVNGKLTTENLMDSIERIRDEADDQDIKYLLLDLTGLAEPISALTRYNPGEKKQYFGYNYKIAAFMQSEKINRLAENTAMNRGANFKVFGPESEARQWLTDKY